MSATTLATLVVTIMAAATVAYTLSTLHKLPPIGFAYALIGCLLGSLATLAFVASYA